MAFTAYMYRKRIWKFIQFLLLPQINSVVYWPSFQFHAAFSVFPTVLSLDFVAILNCLILVFSSSTRSFKIIACNFSYSHTVYCIIFSLKFFLYDKLTCFLLKFNWIVKSRILMAMWKNLHTGTLALIMDIKPSCWTKDSLFRVKLPSSVIAKIMIFKKNTNKITSTCVF